MILLGTVLLLQLAAPVALLAWLSAGTFTSRAETIATALLAALWLLAIERIGFWYVLPRWLLWVLAAAWLGAVWQAWRKARSGRAWPANGRLRLRTATIGLVALGSGAIWIAALAGRSAPAADAVDLAFPLRQGHFVVANGGSNVLINAHLETLDDPRFAPVRGQAYAIDVVAVNAIGTHATGLLPADPARYVIYGVPVHAPCAGTVAQIENTLPDLSPPQSDARNPAGNSILIDCGGFTVLLAHLRQGSVRVRPGQRVSEGEVIGAVGNSGNTDEPHLHLHAQRPGSGAMMLGGEPLWMRFDGTSPVRNERFGGN